MELFDGYYKDGTPSGQKFVRGTKAPKNLYQLICDVLVRHTDGDYLLMQRDYSKPSHAGEFEATACGGAITGETPLQCIKRELREETGISSDSFQFVNDYFDENHRGWFRCFFCETNCDKNSITLQQGETIGYQWVSEDEFVKYLNSSEFNPVRRLRFAPYFKKMGYID